MKITRTFSIFCDKALIRLHDTAKHLVDLKWRITSKSDEIEGRNNSVQWRRTREEERVMKRETKTKDDKGVETDEHGKSEKQKVEKKEKIIETKGRESAKTEKLCGERASESKN